MERKRVNSSKIRAAGYDVKSQVLEIEFKRRQADPIPWSFAESIASSWPRLRRRAFSKTRSTKVFRRPA